MGVKKFFSITFAIVIFLRALTWHEFANYIPYTEVTLLYLVFWSIVLLKNGKISIPIRAEGVKVLLVLTIYFVIWGIFVIPEAKSDANGVMFRSLLMIIFIVVSSLCIRKFNCIDEIVKSSFVALTSLLLIVCVIYHSEIDLVATIKTFWIPQEWLRTRARLGFSNNIPAEYAMSNILLSIYLIKSGIKHKKVIYLIDLLMTSIIIANNSRGTLVALIVMGIVYLNLKVLKPKKIKRLLKIAIILIFTAVFFIVINSVKGNIDIMQLLDGTNRTHFIKNLNALAASGKWLMGFGNISGSFFSEGTIVYGVQLDYMEVAYISYFVCGGIIGSILILYAIFTLLFSIIKYMKINDIQHGKWYLLVYLYMLFLSLFEGYLFSPTYVTSTLFLLLIINYIDTSYLNMKRTNVITKPSITIEGLQNG